jgi:hypothetical protein
MLTRCFARYELNIKLEKLIEKYAAHKKSNQLSNIVYRMKFLKDSYDNDEMINDFLKARVSLKLILVSEIELENFLKSFHELFAEEKIKLEKSEKDPEIKFTDGVWMTTTYKNTEFKLAKCYYDYYSKFATPNELLAAIMYYSNEFQRYNIRLIDNKFFKEILTLAPKNVIQVIPNFVRAPCLELVNEYKHINFSMHTFDVWLNKPFLASDHYLSDRFADNSIVYVTNFNDFNTANLLIKKIIPEAIKKYKNICFLALNIFTTNKIIIDMIKNRINKNDQSFLKLEIYDIYSCSKYFLDAYPILGYISYSADFPFKNVEHIRNLFEKYKNNQYY